MKKQFLLLLTAVLEAAASMAQSPAWTRNEFPPVKGQYEYRMVSGKNKDIAWQSLQLELCQLVCGVDVSAKTTGHQRHDEVHHGREENEQRTIFNVECGCPNKIWCIKVDEYTHTSGYYYALYEYSTMGRFTPYFPPREQKVVDAQIQNEGIRAAVLMADGHNVYANGVKLHPSQVVSIMDGNVEAIERYSAGLREWKSGRNWLIAGTILTPVFITGTVAAFYISDIDKNNVFVVGIVGIVLSLWSISSVGMGIACIGNGRYYVRDAVNMHNRSRSVSKVEWGFGVTQQGLLGFVIKF